MIEFKEVKRRDDAEEPRRILAYIYASLGQFELALVMPPHFKRNQQEVDGSKRHKVMFVKHFVDGKKFRRAVPRKVELRCSLVNEAALEALWTG